jgi:type I restriction enzyme S subunit
MPKATEEGYPYVSTKDFISSGEIDYENAKKISEEDYMHLCRKIKPEKNDILLSRYGTVGEVRLVKTDFPFQASYSIAILKTIYDQTLINFLTLALRSKIIQDQIRFYIRGVAQPDLGLAHIRELQIPIPCSEEQEEILSKFEELEIVTQKTNLIIGKKIKKIDSLRKSILKNAFSGKLIQFQN